MTVSGPTLRARVTQVFRNTTNDWVEATYVYPLPDGGAVDTLKMVIGDRVVVGDIKEQQQAAIYEEAKRNGQKAALIEQERPNIFTNAVANIGPGETVVVQIEYQEPVHSRAGSRCACRSWSARATTRRRRCRRRLRTARMAGAAPRSGARPRPHRRRRCSTRAKPPVNPVTITVHSIPASRSAKSTAIIPVIGHRGSRRD